MMFDRSFPLRTGENFKPIGEPDLESQGGWNPPDAITLVKKADVQKIKCTKKQMYKKCINVQSAYRNIVAIDNILDDSSKARKPRGPSMWNVAVKEAMVCAFSFSPLMGNVGIVNYMCW